MVFNKNNKKEITAIEDLVKAKVFVNPTRFDELSRLKEEIWSPDAKLPEAPCSLLCFNLSPAVEEALRSLEGYTLQVEQISEDPEDPTHKKDRKRFVKVFCGKVLEKGNVGAIVHELGSQEDELSLLDRRVIALSLLNKLPVVVVATGCPDALPAASAASGDTWPVFFVPHPEHMKPVCQWLTTELPRVRALSLSIETDLQARVAHLARVNVPLHFLSRASVALVPFGVMTVNFLGILRLMATMLQCVGMRGDTSANRALGLLGAKNAALVTAIDSMGDVYSFAVFTTVLADLQAMGLVEAAAAMDVLDGLMLGSISVVTGAVSALGAYLSRPVMVRAAAEFLASLQTVYVLNATMRRKSERRPDGKVKKPRGRGNGGADMVVLQGLMPLSKHKFSRSDRGVAKLSAVAQAAVAQAAVGKAARAAARGVAVAAAESGASSVSSSSDEGEDQDEGEEDNEPVAAVESVCGGGDVSDREGLDTAEAAAAGPSNVGAEADAYDGATARVEVAGATSASSSKLQRTEKKLQEMERRQAAQEAARAAKDARAAAKDAAKADKQAVKVDIKQRKHKAKEEQREQRDAENAAARLAKDKTRAARREPAVLQAEVSEVLLAPEVLGVPEADEDGLAERLASSAAAAASGGSESSRTVPPAKERWWRRKKGAAAAASWAVVTEPMETDAGQEPVEADGAAAGAGESGGASGSDRRGSSGSGAEDEEVMRQWVEEAMAREERMGLDEEACRGLMEFLNLADEEVYAEGSVSDGKG